MTSAKETKFLPSKEGANPERSTTTKKDRRNKLLIEKKYRINKKIKHIDPENEVALEAARAELKKIEEEKDKLNPEKAEKTRARKELKAEKAKRATARAAEKVKREAEKAKRATARAKIEEEKARKEEERYKILEEKEKKKKEAQDNLIIKKGIWKKLFKKNR